MAAAQPPNKTLEAMVPTLGESQMIGAAPSIGAAPRPAEDRMLRPLKGTDDKPIEGVEKYITFARGARQSISSISWICRTNGGNRLNYPAGVPFKARYLAWSVSNISWQAGLGFPVFTSYCPVSDYDYRFNFPDAFRFQIVPVFGDHYWLGCGPSLSATGNRATEVWVWVNDFPDLYGDNAGTFQFCVTGWST